MSSDVASEVLITPEDVEEASDANTGVGLGCLASLCDCEVYMPFLVYIKRTVVSSSRTCGYGHMRSKEANTTFPVGRVLGCHGK
jgi:hypothetical protein